MDSSRRMVLLILMAFCMGGALRAKDTPDSILGRLPERLAECQKGEYKDYGDARLGGSVSYKTEGLIITAYVYDMGHVKIADGLQDPVVQNAFRMAKQDIQTALERGTYAEAQLISEGVAFVGEHGSTFQAKYDLVRKQGADAGLKVYSEIHVFGAWNQIIKLRISGDRSSKEKTEPIVRKFVEAFWKAIEFLPPKRPE